MEQFVPASIGYWVLSIYMIVDTAFVGHYVGPVAIGGITVVLPLSFLLTGVGMSIGVGGGALISQALGEQNEEKAFLVFAQQLVLIAVLAGSAILVGIWFQTPLLRLFGGHGELLPPAQTYFAILLVGVPFLSWAMMSNTVIRAEGHARVSMLVMMIPAFGNILLDFLFIVVMDWGLEGAAWSTVLSYLATAVFTTWFVLSPKSALKIRPVYLKPDIPLMKKILAIGSVTLARQAVVSFLSLIANNFLFHHGGALAVSAYGILNRALMFCQAPLMGITTGMMPIIAYNFGAGAVDRVRSALKTTLLLGGAIAMVIVAVVIAFAHPIASIFTENAELQDMAAHAMRWVFAALPFALPQMTLSSFFQSLGKPVPAFLLGISRQGLILMPLIPILSAAYGLEGVWRAFPTADLLSAVATAYGFVVAHRHLKAVQVEPAPE